MCRWVTDHLASQVISSLPLHLSQMLTMRLKLRGFISGGGDLWCEWFDWTKEMKVTRVFFLFEVLCGIESGRPLAWQVGEKRRKTILALTDLQWMDVFVFFHHDTTRMWSQLVMASSWMGVKILQWFSWLGVIIAKNATLLDLFLHSFLHVKLQENVIKIYNLMTLIIFLWIKSIH